MIEIKNFGICNLSVAPVRSAASDTSEIVTQLLFGDHVEILEKGTPWIKIRFVLDKYEGWMDFKQLTYIDESEYKQIAHEKRSYLMDPLMILNGPRGKQSIMLGSSLPQLSNQTVQFGNESYELEKKPNDFSQSITETALGYLNTPYLWGGKSIFGIDCSGLTQNVFKVHGFQLPRDASQQVNEGQLIPYEEREVGDVPFFINANGVVHHVGILTSKDEIIHAAGCVRIDPFDDQGIFRKDLDCYTHHYHSIKRY